MEGWYIGNHTKVFFLLDASIHQISKALTMKKVMEALEVMPNSGRKEGGEDPKQQKFPLFIRCES